MLNSPNKNNISLSISIEYSKKYNTKILSIFKIEYLSFIL